MTKALTIEEIVEATGAVIVSGSGAGEVGGVSTDTRTVKEGDVFFALKGPNFDGALFLDEAAEKGATVAVVSASAVAIASKGGSYPEGLTVITTEDSLRALGDLAAVVRRGARAKVLAVTGSVGKTTTKDMAASILAEKKRVLKSEGNRNNLIGLPTALLGLTDAHDVAVVELGINEVGEMERLSEIAAPDVALITNIGVAHTEGLGGIDGVAREKGKIFASLAAGAAVVVNMDDPLAVEAARALPDAVERVTFGRGGGRGGEGPALDVTIREVSLDKDTATVDVAYEVRGEDVYAVFASPLLANAVNGAAAMAACLPLGATASEMTSALAAFTGPAGRMEVVRTGAGVTIIDDSYNANPESMKAALDTFAVLDGPRVAVIGEMLELGDLAWLAHRSAGRLAATAGLKRLVAVGARAGEIVEGAVAAGMKHGEVLVFTAAGDAADAVAELVEEGDTVLVKGSRGVGLGVVVERLINKGAA